MKTMTTNKTAQARAEEEIVTFFREWFADASRRDLDAVMAKIATDVVSYEHDAPLVHEGTDKVREICRRGFESADGDFSWDVPDLHILVRGDLAVTWGLNRMAFKPPGQPPIVSWSRGTRILQKVDGKWIMIHQHVSYPNDPATGQARTDLVPDEAPNDDHAVYKEAEAAG